MNIMIADKILGKDSPTFIVAEIGANHNGDLDLAKRTIEAAAHCGVDAVKFQTYSANELLADHARIITYGNEGKEYSEPIGDMFDRLALKREHHHQLFEYAKSFGLIPFSTPFSIEGVNFLNFELEVDCFKVAASDVNYLTMLEELGKTKKPVMLSLGKCTIGEADLAIQTLIDAGCEELIIMHCVAQYPSPMEDMNLKIINTLSSMYPNCIIGFSDHSLGITATLGAVVLGAKVVEKHFTLDKKLEGPDHWFSMDPLEMKELVTEVRNMEVALGTSQKRIMPSERDERKTSIRSIVLNENVEKGQTLEIHHIKYTRPGWGISPSDIDKILGLKVSNDLPKNTVLKWKHFK